MSESFCVADRERVEQVLDRLTRQVNSTLPEDACIVGIRRRGVPLAQQIADRLAALTGSRPAEFEVTAKRYTDDLTLLHQETKLDESKSAPPAALHGRTVMLVDDVLFSGRTLWRVLQWLRSAEPTAVSIAVLCARDTQEIPLRAHYVGLQLDVGPSSAIDVHAPPYEDEWSVWLSQTELK